MMVWHKIVTEGQPPAAGKYLVATRNVVGTAWFVPEGGEMPGTRWSALDLPYRLWLDEADITHWAEMPAPPEG